MARLFQKEKILLPILLEIDTSSDKIVLKLQSSLFLFPISIL
jgi:hypothetical protein